MKRNWIENVEEMSFVHSEVISTRFKIEIIAILSQYHQQPVVFLPGSERKDFLPKELYATDNTVRFFQPHHFGFPQILHAIIISLT
jgi:hypothetical protein